MYVLSNPSMPGLVKIGRTARSVEQRAAELWQTGVPTPFMVEYFQLFPNCVEAEAEIHETFIDQREVEQREFFRVPVDDVISAIQDNIFWTIQEIAYMYGPSFRVLDKNEATAFQVVEKRSKAIGVNTLMMALGVCERPSDILWADVEAMQARVAKIINQEDAA